MTPRTIKGGIDVDFARQMRERNAALQPRKKFKTSAPKGVKYGAGYTDRAKAREESDQDQDSKESRIKALEEQMKLGQIPNEMFEALRDEITGGDVSSTHLVKGLDRRLLERVRRGEDVLGTGIGSNPAEGAPDVDEELDKLGEKAIQTPRLDKAEKKGSMALPPSMAGKKRSRDEIMAELKSQRQAAAQAKTSSVLDSRWRRVGEKQESRTEIDHKGREVLITVDEDGVVKRKVRKAPEKAATDMPDASRPVLGSDVVVPEQEKVEDCKYDEDEDIFDGAGTEYNPLGDDDEDDDNDDNDEDDEVPDRASVEVEESTKASRQLVVTAATAEPTTAAEEGQEAKPAAPRHNYFNDSKSTIEEPSKDRFANIEEVLKKAARLDPLRSGTEDETSNDESGTNSEAQRKKRAQMLVQQDRDLDDMDMGFGSSRFEDEEDGGESKKMRLSEWKGGANDDDGVEENGKGGDKKKRKPKKRKGDVNNAADIMRVVEGRKGGGTK